MLKKHYAFIICISFIVGMFIYGIGNQNIIFLSPFCKETLSTPNMIVTKKKITLHYWHNDIWKHEEVDIIWSDDLTQTVTHLVNQWLSLLDEEKDNNKKVSLQSIALSPSGQEVFLSFDRNPFEKRSTSYEKWLWVESLLKTIRENNIGVKSIQLLIHHQPMNDYHIDFSKPWPLEGFLKRGT